MVSKFWYSEHINSLCALKMPTFSQLSPPNKEDVGGEGPARSSYNIIYRAKCRLLFTQEDPEEVKIKFSTG